MVMDVHLHAGCILMTYNAASPVKLVPLSDPLMGKLSTTKRGENFIFFLLYCFMTLQLLFWKVL